MLKYPTRETIILGGTYKTKGADVTDEFGDDIFKLINKYRAENNLHELKYDSRLDALARERAMEQAYYNNVRGEISHDGLRDGNRPKSVGENISLRDSRTKDVPMTVFTGWKNSPGHNANMLYKEALSAGIGVYRDDETGVYYSVYIYNINPNF